MAKDIGEREKWLRQQREDRAIRAEKAAALAKRGRPKIEEKDKTLTATKPWQAAGMSRATWYQRQKKTES